jgi:1L-myo-inositol 1-phosphate cytidylyltransferase / CDP-L-myo-inositol myo-inositolphosphotransferase
MRAESDDIDQPSETSGNLDRPLAILNACPPGAWEKVGGIPLVARTLFHLNRSGVKKALLLIKTEKAPADLKRWQGNVRLEQVTVKEEIAGALLSAASLDQHYLYVDAAHLIDPRLLHALCVASETTLAYVDPSDRKKQIVRAGFLKGKDLQRWAREGDASLVRSARSLFPEEIDPFSPEARGPVPSYFIEVRSREEARKATSLLIRNQQKHVMDLPAQYIDPPFENAITRLLCNTPVTPNMVTFAGVAVAVAVAWLFWHGHFWVGALGTFLVEILDGVDGKLARTKLHYTKLGHYEDVIDYFCETSWYVALGVGLRGAHANLSSGHLAGLLILSDTADNIFYTLAGKWHGKSIDLFSPFDGAFRRIAGRRNIYGIMFIIGFSLGYPVHTFALAAVWAALTAGIHGSRLIQYGRMMKGTLGRQPEGTS